MKKNHLFGMFAMAAFAFASCSQDEVVTQSPEVNKAIEFGTYVGRDAVSRAHVIKVSELAEEGFGVFAYYTNGADFDATTSTPNFMYNQKVMGQATTTTTGEGDAAVTNTTYSTSVWEYSPLKYWPNENGAETADKLSFFAYAPYTQQPATGDGDSDYNIGKHSLNTAGGLPSFTFYVHPTVKEQVDLLWATPQLNLTKQTVTGNVDFKFHHALARIGFSVQAMFDVVNNDEDGTADDNQDVSGNFEVVNNQETTTISVESVELTGAFYNAGTLVYSNSTGNYTAAFTGQTTPASTTYTLTGENFDAVAQKVTLADTKLNKDDSYIMVIPKSFTADSNNKLTLKVVYKVKTIDSNLSVGYSEITNTITKTFNIASGFEAGKAYNFSLHLGLTSVKLTASVDNWIDGANPETDYAVNVPLNFANGNNQ